MSVPGWAQQMSTSPSAGVDWWLGTEEFGVDAGRVDADCGKRLLHVGHERGRPADVGVRAGRKVEPGQFVFGQVPGDGVDAVSPGGVAAL